MLLTVAVLALDVLKPLDPAGPSFDCSKATAVVPLLICADDTLIGLDRDMASRYAAWRSAHPADADAVKRQAGWLAQRDACASAAERQACVSSAYQQRITELKILAGQAPVFAAATYLCAGQAGVVTASYYHSAPAAVLIEYQGARVVAFSVPAGSGARYTAEGVELWEHQGTAALKWRGQDLKCPRSQNNTTTSGQHP
ncbi:MAG TPA: MliC family protein [Steroidobacteraceae bacterium]|jgi:uncharacterized protein